MTGETLGNYKLGAKLGSGSMGVVFVGEHQRIARRVAIKLLIPELSRDPLVLQRFFNEARATSLIRHPGIVDVFDCGVDDNGRAYIVMEHLEGETLGATLRRMGKLPWVEACAVAGHVADALGAAHKKRIIHRDLKPENVFLVGDPAAVKVLDFGIAKLQAVDAPIRLTIKGMLMGTPEYMSPEQCRASEEIDHRADIYALGCILFEMLSGEPPFMTSTVQELIAAHMFRPAPSLATRASDVPVWLGDLVARMLAKQPLERPSSMHEVSKTLREHGARGGVGRSTMVIVRRPRAQRAQIAAAAVVAGVLVVAGGIWAARGRPAPTRAGPAPAVEPIRKAETQQPLPAAAGLLLPTDAAPPPLVTNDAVDPAPPARKPPERTVRPVRRARPSAPQPQHPVDTDGIVDL